MDDGTTLSPEQLVKVWTPYYQAEKGFSGSVPGMGLGLAMIASLLWSVGGTYSMTNREPGPGVVVELVIPLAQQDAAEPSG
jgi:K+-sensing histidine kinase KdpD